MTITSGVRCESFNKSIKGSLVSSHMPDSDRIGLAVDIAFTNTIDRHELVEVAQKFFKRIGIAGEHSGNFIHLDVLLKQDPKRCCGLIEGVSPSFKPNQELKRFSRETSRRC